MRRQREILHLAPSVRISQNILLTLLSEIDIVLLNLTMKGEKWQ